MRKHMRLAALLTVAATTLLAMPAATQPGGTPNPAILPVNSNPFGLSYGEWSVRQWQWAYSMPAEANPLCDTAPPETGQSGKVWFLGGTFAPTVIETPDCVLITGEGTRSVSVPTGKALFFPVLDAEASVFEGYGTTYPELLAAAASLMDQASGLSCEVDGVPVKDIGQYRVQSPLFAIGPLPENNVFWPDTAGLTTQAVSDGIFLMLAPLSAGPHTIHFAGSVVLADDAGVPFLIFSLDYTYNITMVSGKK